METISQDRSRLVIGVFIAFALVWTVIWLIALTTVVSRIRKGAEDSAVVSARAEVDWDIVYRRWNAERGGVYAPISEATPANPWLDVPYRDIVTEDGTEMTLINPAYMTRQVHELAFETDGIRGHITSLDPIRPQNAADSWERRVLPLFEHGTDETFEVVTLEEEPFLRYMRPLVTEESCLACHAVQGYRLGDIRGGISVSVPLREYYQISRAAIAPSLGIGVSVWLLGLLGIGLSGRAILTREQARAEALAQVRGFLGEKELLLREIQHRIKNNMAVMSALLGLQEQSSGDESVRDALRVARTRFSGMNALYDRLYRSDDPDSIAIDTWLPDVVRETVASFPQPDRITLHISVEAVRLNAAVLAPLGIFCTEVVVNAMKHAFPYPRTGVLSVEGRVKGDEFVLSIHDDGPGFDGDTAGSGFGLQMYTAIAEQVDGQVSVSGDGGATVVLRVSAIDRTVPVG